MPFFRNKVLRIIFLCLCSLGPLSVQAEERGVVLFRSSRQQTTLMEIYVSQGCSSCPPAEEWGNTFTTSPRLWTEVIPVIFHVDYWDYLGWKDPFSSRAYTDRQHTYKTKGYINSVYTPGFVVNGKEWRGWFQQETLPEQKANPGILEARLDSGQLFVTFGGKEAGSLVLNMAVLGFGLQTDVTHGENRNKLLKEDFVVFAFESHVSENNTWQITFPPKIQHKVLRMGLALWVTRKGDISPLQATGGWVTIGKK